MTQYIIPVACFLGAYFALGLILSLLLLIDAFGLYLIGLMTLSILMKGPKEEDELPYEFASHVCGFLIPSSEEEEEYLDE